MDITGKSEELKKVISQFNTPWFLGNLGSLIQSIGKGANDQLGKLSSPMRQLTYLGGLNISSGIGAEKTHYSNEEWDEIVNLLNDIEHGYDEMFQPKIGEEVDDEWIEKRKVVVPAFLSYFNQGHLNYEEQVIERIETYFSSFDDFIEDKIGLCVEDLINMYNFLDNLQNKKINKVSSPQTADDFVNKFFSGIMEEGKNPESYMSELMLEDRDPNIFDLVSDRGISSRFTKDDLVKEFGEEKANAFISFLKIRRSKTPFLYYTEQNPIDFTPIFEVEEDRYQVFSHIFIIHAIYANLMNLLISDNIKKEKFYKKRGDELENKIINLFDKFFSGKARIYKSYYTDIGNEQDVLVLIGNLALIIEAKASKRDEPRRDPNRAYPILKHNFEEVIQKGYNQAYRVEKLFSEEKEFNIYREKDKKDVLETIETKNYKNVFSIVVTLESFAQVQTDLYHLLNTTDDDAPYPWSVSIDNLETFLLGILKLGGNSRRRFTNFLEVREWLHGGVLCSDELEICADYLNGRFRKMKIKEDDLVIPIPHSPDLFDNLYRKGLGFENEKYLEKKKSKKFISL
ncbi:MAG: hypothetical protein ACI85O_001006 [Saprospiraceae bacterium]|jgi:hypothetical protein